MCLAIPGEVVGVSTDQPGLATVDIGGVRRTVNVMLLDDVACGDWVLVHVGFAMSRIDEAEAHATLEMLAAMGEAYDDELDALRESRLE